MRELAFLNPAPVYIEVSDTWLKALQANSGLEVSLQREPGGRLTSACRQELTQRLRAFLQRKSWQPRIRALCAIGARGVSLRRFNLPVSTETEFRKLLVLQIEREFPLPPDELAWGYRRIESNGARGKCEVLVAAVKKEVVEEYAGIFSACGLNPVFSLAALARNCLCPQRDGSHAMLDLGGARPEWAAFENGQAVALRVLPLAEDASLVDSLAKSLGAIQDGRKVFLTSADDARARQLASRLGDGVECKTLAAEPGPGRTAAILGLKKADEENGGAPPLVLQAKARQRGGTVSFSAPEVKPWLARAAVLAALLLLLPYAEAFLLKPFLARRLSALKSDKSRLVTIDRELQFMQFLAQSQPPYLDTLFLFAKSAPPGARTDSLTMNRRGEISLRGAMQNGQQVTDFRSKLIASGFFSNVVVEEQAPSPDRQKVNVRMTAQWKAAEARASLAIGPTAEEIEKAKTNKTAQAGGAMPAGMMPPAGMPGTPREMPAPPPGRK